ncbi:hypothetical protein BCON_0032g00650 [Botryotinia convoluta]|uniref:AAA+ ATPase domain-containing protein n=1 Tax=Botryotinia convoluta TaxID=54673 RepID=A0A4Z1IGU3_9HELO|nr:hypothetical protein BCON_0032g00650 [Botryotinia convoluta]
MENSEIEDVPSAKRAADSMPAPISESDVLVTTEEISHISLSEKSPESSNNVDAKIKYTLDLDDTKTGDQLTIGEENPLFDLAIFNGDFKLDEENHQSESSRSPTIFEVIVEAQGYVEPFENSKEETLQKINGTQDSDADKSKIERPNSQTVELPVTKAHGKDLVKITKINETRIHSHSQSLIKIRNVLTPSTSSNQLNSQTLDGRVVIIQKPYWVLIHHEKELHEKHTQLTEQSECTEADKEKAEHLKALLDFIKPQSMKLLQPILPLLKNKVPTVSFDGLRYLLKPGTLAYYKFDNEWIGCIILRVNPEAKRKSSKIANWSVSVWYLEWSYHAYRIETKFDIESFEGKRDITSLKVIPREYWDANDNNARRKKFEDRGLKKMTLLKSGHKQMDYKGKTAEEEERQYHGRIIVDDLQGLAMKADTVSKWTSRPDGLTDDKWMGREDDSSDNDEDDEDGDIERTRTSKLAKLEELGELKSIELDKLSKEQLFLMLPSIPCYALDIKSWCTGHVERMHEIDPITNPPKPVMKEGFHEIIQALFASQHTGKPSGPPGVGKTYSVECVAISTGRPLLALTIADIGTKEDMIETELSSLFYLAERWKAVLLIDEADIFLERRKHTDLALMELSRMEYFQGLLFLTTNRVGQIDEAFTSRVDVVIEYPPLDDESRRQIWDGLFEKMYNETDGKIKLSLDTKKYVKQDAERLGIGLNGREIRNALQTAISLADFEAKGERGHKESDPINVEKGHFERVFELSKSFRSYLNSIKRDTPESRAQNYYGRNDSYQGSSDDRTR